MLFRGAISSHLDVRQPRRVNPEVLDLAVITALRTHSRRWDQASFAFAAVLLDENLNTSGPPAKGPWSYMYGKQCLPRKEKLK